MNKSPEEQLQIGRVAFAKAFCADWISEHSKILLATLATLIVLTFFLFQISNRFFSSGRPDPAKTEQVFKAWSAATEIDFDLLKQLEAPLNYDPSLRAKFGNQIAQHLLVLGAVDKAQDYAKTTAKRTHHLASSYYTRFSQNTFSIVSGDYAAALTAAKQLKTDLENDTAFWNGRDKIVKSGTVLYAYNLLRIASLERALGSAEGELAAWSEFVANAGWSGQPKNGHIYDPDAYSQVASNFQKGETTLLEFIQKRQSQLQPLR